MRKIFIGGSRSVTRLDADARARLDGILREGLPIVIGDANGADRAVQQYLKGRGYAHVEVFCAAGSCRNNVGGWPVREIPATAPSQRKTFRDHTAKDRRMAEECSSGIMLWDGRSPGTALNVLRLLRAGKPVAVYLTAQCRFTDLRNREDWDGFAALCEDEVRERVEREVAFEANTASQGILF